MFLDFWYKSKIFTLYPFLSKREAIDSKAKGGLLGLEFAIFLSKG